MLTGCVVPANGANVLLTRLGLLLLVLMLLLLLLVLLLYGSQRGVFRLVSFGVAYSLGLNVLLLQLTVRLVEMMMLEAWVRMMLMLVLLLLLSVQLAGLVLMRMMVVLLQLLMVMVMVMIGRDQLRQLICAELLTELAAHRVRKQLALVASQVRGRLSLELLDLLMGCGGRRNGCCLWRRLVGAYTVG